MISRFFCLSQRIDSIKIGGPGIIVEVDESKFGKRKYNRGHHVEGVWVLGMVERTDARRIVLVAVKDRTKKTLHDLIEKHVARGSILYSDFWKGYLGIDKKGYDHVRVNRSLHFKDPNTGAHTNTIEGNWAPI